MTAQKVRLQIEKKGFVSLFDDISIPITKSLKDIRDLSQRTGGYTTGIEVPGDQNNCILFGHLYDLNIINGSFDIKRKYTCIIIKDDVQIFQGYIKLEGINQYEGPDGQTILTFNISLQDAVANFYGKIKDLYISPLDNIQNNNSTIYGNNTSATNNNQNNIWFDDLIGNKYNYPNIITTFGNTWKNKWKYILPSQTRGYYQTTDFKPGIYAYEYINRIIESAGYSWNGSTQPIVIASDNATAFIEFTISTQIITILHQITTLLVGDYINISDAGANSGLYTITNITTDSSHTYLTVKETISSNMDAVCYWTIYRDEMVNQPMWDLLNNSINLDKLIIPYMGGEDVVKSLPEYGVYAGQDLSYNIVSLSNAAYDSGGIAMSGISSVTDPIKNIGDIIRIKDGTTYYYFEVLTKLGYSSGIWSYTVHSVDINWNRITNSTLTLLDTTGNILVQRGLLYPLCINLDNSYWQYVSNEVSGSFNSSQYISWFNLETNPYYDTNNSYSVNLSNVIGGKNCPVGTYISKNNGILNIIISQNYDIVMTNNIDCFCASDIVGGSILYFALDYIVYKNGIEVNNFSKILDVYTTGGMGYVDGDGEVKKGASKTTPIKSYWYDDTLTSPPTGTPIYLAGDNYLFNDIVNDIITIPVVINDSIQVAVKGHLWSPGSNSYFNNVNTSLSAAAVNCIFKIRPRENSTIRFKITGNYQEDDVNIKIKDFIPRKVKQSDFLLGFCKMFNLMIDFDETKKQLLILPTDQYYSLGNIIDISHKIDISNTDNAVMFLPDLTYKNYIYTYKKDGDTYNSSYFTQLQKTYGQVDITFDNDYLVGTTTIDSIFTSTPIARIGGTGVINENGHAVSATKTLGNLLSIIDYSGGAGLKCLYDTGLISDSKSEGFMFRRQSAEARITTGVKEIYYYTIAADTTNSLPLYNVQFLQYVKLNSDGAYLYPYVGHFDLPTAPNRDLNYAQADYYFYNDIVPVTQNNLFYSHYERTIRQQNDGKLLKCRIYMTAQELAKINFYDTYYCLETYWHLNLLKYNPQNPNLIDCEFISI